VWNGLANITYPKCSVGPISSTLFNISATLLPVPTLMGRITSAATCSLNMWYAILTCLFLRVESGSPTDDQQHTMSHMNHHLLYSTSEIQIIGVLQQRGCLVGVPDSLAIRRSSVCVPIYLYRSNSLLSQYPTPESNLDGVPPGPLRIFTRCLCQA